MKRAPRHGHFPVAAGVFVEEQYKVLLSGVEYRESFDGSRFVPHDEQGGGEDGAVFRKVRSPALVQTIVKAYFSEGDWLASYDTMRLVPAGSFVPVTDRSD